MMRLASDLELALQRFGNEPMAGGSEDQTDQSLAQVDVLVQTSLKIIYSVNS